MKMVLTRQGFNSKMVVTGDVTQIDLPSGKQSGLLNAAEVLRGVEGISFVYFDDKDVVRHSLVQRIVIAYERFSKQTGVGQQLALRLGPDATPAAEDGATADVPAPAADAAEPAPESVQ
jgi:phosphate starvation-inducible PhoH-like protein